MPRGRTPRIGRPFNQPVTHNQFNDQARAVENTQALSVTPPLTIENTLTGGQRLGINLLPQTAATVSDVKAIAQVVVVPNDQVEEDQPTANSEAVVIRRMTEPDPYTGWLKAGDAVVMKTWWPLKNSDYDAVRYRDPLNAGDLLSPANLPILLAAFDVSGGFRAYKAATETGTAIKQFKIVRTAHSDVIECIDFTGGVITSLDPIWVAKDWFMRGPDTWHGEIRNDVRYSYDISTTTQIRTATKAGRTEEQTIVPAYKGGDVIIVFRVDTGVIVPGTEGHDEPTKVKWIEPAGTRMWQVLP